VWITPSSAPVQKAAGAGQAGYGEIARAAQGRIGTCLRTGQKSRKSPNGQAAQGEILCE